MYSVSLEELVDGLFKRKSGLAVHGSVELVDDSPSE